MPNESNDRPTAWGLACPVPIDPQGERVTLVHGEGGRLMRRLIRERILPRFDGRALNELGDAARLESVEGRLAVTTDSFVVSPLFFPGGDIGSLAVHGTVNDLAVAGARPLWLTLSLILEEGLPLSVLEAVLESVAQAARETNVAVVTGDTKVVPRGAADGLFLNTTGIGQLIDPVPPGPTALGEGDELLVTGPVGRHGIAVLSARESFGFEPPPRSDSAPLVRVAETLRAALGPRVRAMRDATRGGVAAVLHEWAEASGHSLRVVERDVPVSADVRGACELLGLDPLHVANEGTMVVAVEPGAGDAAVAALQGIPESCGSARIGRVTRRGLAPVTVERMLGPEQILDDPAGAPLPRIC